MSARSWLRNRMQEDMQCVLCGKPALYMANLRGFCKGHKADAEKTQRNAHLRHQARNEAARDSHGDWEKRSDNKMRRNFGKKEWK